MTADDIQKLVEPNHTALVVIDKQYGYFDRQVAPTANAQAKVAAMDEFILKARAVHIPVFWTKMIENIDDSPENLRFIMRHDEDYVELTREYEQTFDIFGEVTPLPAEPVIVKKRYNAFAETELGELLRAQGIKTVIFIGGYASRCVFASVIGASDNGFYPVVVEELVANPDKYQDEVAVALRIISHIHGTVLAANSVTKSWQV